VLIRATVLSGFETGTGSLNPHGQFQKLKPAAVIDYGVFVYDGHFEIPLAAALRHVQKREVSSAKRMRRTRFPKPGRRKRWRPADERPT